MQTPTLNPNPLTEKIYLFLKDHILQGRFHYGEKLSENTLAQQFSCSRTPVREALKRLEHDGFVTIIAHSGSYVKDPSMSDNQQLTEVRAYLEALAIRLCCLENRDTSELETILSGMDAIGEMDPFDAQTFSKLHYRFHLSLVQLADNSLLTQTYERLNLNESALLFAQKLTKAGIRKTQEEHRKLVKAIKDQDEKAGERFMLSHLWRKRDQFKSRADQG
ncbi:GntR family transcriptional regulator [Sphaerochaeta sp. PS]|uniref:GntR family transcriptional regulator n=1 Tax=Sphaerochaeta sp. PS TaxID=3076336 RepID=UPI0028A36FCD|nr:GntR family transcriptional regulator [Sphaerochaeta sp. PS]MDT4762807.1 GntR family transcriptional regulator [Sphaerochaeta sp. PS]